VNAPQSIVEAQTDALLRRVAREQDMRARQARESAVTQARAILDRSWDEARARLRQAVLEERRSVEQAIADRRAAHETVARQRSQSTLRAVLDEAWQALPAALASVWLRSDARQRWCRAACSAAVRVLDPARGCRIEIDAGTAADVEAAARKALGDWAGLEIGVERVAGLGPGIRIRCGRACVDATVAGLLASRERIEAELLAEMERLGTDSGKAPA
jgi:hypothetical protein